MNEAVAALEIREAPIACTLVIDGAGEVTAETGAFTVPVTFPSTTGEAAGETTPEELLTASHATCLARGHFALEEYAPEMATLITGFSSASPPTSAVLTT